MADDLYQEPLEREPSSGINPDYRPPAPAASRGIPISQVPVTPAPQSEFDPVAVTGIETIQGPALQEREAAQAQVAGEQMTAIGIEEAPPEPPPGIDRFLFNEIAPPRAEMLPEVHDLRAPTEQEARKAMNLIAPGASDEEVARAQETVNRYLENKRDDERAEQIEFAQQYYTDDTKRKQLAQHPDMKRATELSPDPELVEQTSINNAWLNANAGRKLSAPELDIARQTVGKQLFNIPNISNQQFFTKMQEWSTGQAAERDVALKLDAAVGAHVLQDQLTRTYTPDYQVLEQLKKEHPEVFTPENERKFTLMNQRMHGRMRQLGEQVLEPYSQIFTLVQKAGKGEVTDEDWAGIVDSLRAIDPEDRQRVWGMVGRAGRAGIIDSKGLAQFMENMSKGWTREFNLSDRTERNAQMELEAIGELVDSGAPLGIDNGRIIQRTGINADRGRPLTDEERFAYREKINRAYDTIGLVREAQEAYETIVDPIRPIFKEGLLSTGERGLYALPAMGKIMIGGMVPGVGWALTFDAIQADIFRRAMLENPDMSAKDASHMATNSAALQTVAEQLQIKIPLGTFGRMLDVERDITQRGFWAAARAAGKREFKALAAENILEGFQDAVDMFYPAIQSQFDPTMKRQDVGEVGWKWFNTRPEVFAAVLVPASIGTGVLTVQDVKNPMRSVFNSDVLRGLGIREDGIQRILGQGSFEAMQSALNVEMAAVTPEERARGHDYISATAAATAAKQTAVASPSYRVVTQNDGTKVYEVLDAAGKVVYSNTDEDLAQAAYTDTVTAFTTSQIAAQAAAKETEEGVVAGAEAEGTTRLLDEPSRTSASVMLDFTPNERPTPELAGSLARLERALAKDPRSGGEPVRLVPQSAVVDGATPAGQRLIAGVRGFERLFGKNVVFVRSGSDAPLPFTGVVISSDPNTIFLDADGDRNVLALLGHEWAHTLERSNPELYKTMVAQMRPLVVDWMRQEKLLSEAEGYPEAQVTDELVGNIIGDSFTRPDFWSALHARNPSLFERMVRAFEEWWNGLMETIRGSEWATEEFISDLTAMHNVIADAIAEAQRAGPETVPRGTEAEVSFARARDESYRTIDQQWWKDFAAWRAGERAQFKKRPFNFGTASDELIAAGFPAAEIVMPAHVLQIKPSTEKHPFPVEKLANLPKRLRDPIAVFRSRTVPDALTVLTEIEHEGKNLLVAVHLKPTADGKSEIASVRSVYPKDTGAMLGWIRDGLATYYHKEKARSWLFQQTAGSNSRPAWIQLQATPNVKTDGDIVKPPSEGEVSLATRRAQTEQDRAYLHAVQGGDIKTAQRMVDEAANRTGFTIGAWKGYDPKKETGETITIIERPSEFPAFNRGEPNVAGIKGFFSSDKAIAEHFTKGIGEGAVTSKFRLAFRNPLEIDAKGKHAGAIQFEATGKPFRDAVRSGKYDGIIIRNTKDEGTVYVALDSKGIKSADPVTYDNGGNVIPLSKRFGETEDIRFATRRGKFAQAKVEGANKEESVAAAFEKLHGQPEKRLQLFQKIKGAFEQVRARHQAVEAKLPEDKLAETQRLHAFAELNAILKALPPEIRGRITPVVSLAQVRATEAGLADFLTKAIGKVDVAIEAALKQEYTTRITQLLERSEPKKTPGGVLKSPLGPEAERATRIARKAVKMDNNETSTRLATIEAALQSPEITEEEQADLVEEWTILNSFGDLDNRNAESLASAHAWLAKIVVTGRSEWRQREQTRAARMQGIRDQIIKGLGRGTRGGLSQKEMSEGGLAMLSSYGLSHSNFLQFLARILPESPFLEDWMNRTRRADNASQDAAIAAGDRLMAHMRSTLGIDSRGGLAQMMWRLKETVKGAVEAYDGRVIDKDGNVTNPGTLEKLDMSRLEAIQFLLGWAQPDVQAKMIAQGWTPDSIAAMEKMTANPESQAVLAFLREEFAASYAISNPIYEALFGMSMPQVKNYAPTRFRATKDAGDIAPFGGPNAASGLTPSYAKSRVNHSAMMDQVDALNVYWQHIAQQAHWTAFAELTRELRSVLGNRDVRASIEQAHGRKTLQQVDLWIDTIANAGGNKAADIIVNARILDVLISGKAMSTLGFSLRTIFAQVDSMMRAVFALPMGRIVKAVADPKFLSNIPKAWHSDSIQRRVKNGGSPEARYLFEQTRLKPSIMLRMGRASMMPIQLTDAGLTSLSSAVVFTDSYNQAIKAGHNKAEATAIAADDMDDAIYRYSQPTGIGSRSLQELTGGQWKKAFMLFMSDARLKTALYFEAGTNIVKGKGTALDWQRVIFVHTAALISQIVLNAYRDTFSDDDDDEIWTAESLWKAVLLGPFQGLVLLGSAADAVASKMIGGQYFAPSRDPMLDAIANGGRALQNLDQAWNWEDRQAMLKEWNAIARAIAVHPVLAAPAVIINFLKPIFGLWANLEEQEE